MNILYLSYMTGNLKAGLTYSIPNQIITQSKYNNVFWYNMLKFKIDLFKKYCFYHDFMNYPNLSRKRKI